MGLAPECGDETGSLGYDGHGVMLQVCAQQDAAARVATPGELPHDEQRRLRQEADVLPALSFSRSVFGFLDAL
jgi:hypothetical protein